MGGCTGGDYLRQPWLYPTSTAGQPKRPAKGRPTGSCYKHRTLGGSALWGGFHFWPPTWFVQNLLAPLAAAATSTVPPAVTAANRSIGLYSKSHKAAPLAVAALKAAIAPVMEVANSQQGVVPFANAAYLNGTCSATRWTTAAAAAHWLTGALKLCFPFPCRPSVRHGTGTVLSRQGHVVLPHMVSLTADCR